jgi:hypothetical protein
MDTQQLLNYVNEIEDIVDMFSSIKPVQSWFVDKKNLYITLQEELYLYEKENLYKKFSELTGSTNQEYFKIDESDETTFVIRL